LGDGWNPFFTARTPAGAVGASVSNATRTAAFETEADLIAGINYMKEHCAQIGRKDVPEVVLGGITSTGEKFTNQQLLDRLGRFRELGVGAAALGVEGRTRQEWCDNAEQLGAEVIAKL
jgi:hypothetical protein